MANQIIIIPDDSANTGKKLDVEQLAVGVNTVQRERHQVAGALDVEIARIENADPSVTDYGLAVRVIGKTFKTFNGNFAANGDNVIIAAVGGKKLKVLVFEIQNQGAANVNAKWTDGAAGAILWGPFTLPQGGDWDRNVNFPAKLFATTAGNALILNLSAAVSCQVSGVYWDDDAS